MSAKNHNWKQKYLDRIDNVRRNYSYRAQKIIQPMYIREVIEQIPYHSLDRSMQEELENKLDRLYIAIPNISETSPKTFRDYRMQLEDFKYYINSHYNLVPLNYYKSVYIPLGIALGLITGLFFGFLIQNPLLGYFIGAVLGTLIGFSIGQSKDKKKGTNKRLSKNC